MGDKKSILIVGGGMSGLTSALEAAEAGYDSIVVEKRPYLGGRVAQLYQYFPKLCPPNCGLEINFKRTKNSPHITFHTLAEVESISGEEGNYTVTIKTTPRLVNENCTGCNKCAEACEVERANDFNYGLDNTKAAYLPYAMAFPMQYVIDSSVCLGSSCGKCAEACQYNAIDLNMKPETFTVNVGAIVWATGWNPYNAGKLENYGFGQYANVITNVMMERLCADNGPTGGKILRPSDQKEVEKVAFIQCAGSRDENHLAYCSGICCLASLKQSTYVREKNPNAEATIYFIDIRAQGKLEDFFVKVKKDDKLSLVKSKIAMITEDPATKDLILEGEDTMSGERIRETVDMVVLATGMEPATASEKVPAEVAYDDYGFITSDQDQKGIYGAGCIKRPADVAGVVQDATGAALRAIQSVVRR
ncbi:MAG TPA: CoB--CoM heterodisulfide reductase iron-sulfur subunit A family protein [Thermodesulfobacteriota bacterium]|nr:CoB--CoM heterodisulfide reductase iron-sulfur subunit A family protein [Thermodesulfobacteriota bacterium]